MKCLVDCLCEIEDCEEEKNAVRLKDAINEAGDGVCTTGFGGETSSASPATVVCRSIHRPPYLGHWSRE